MKACRWPAATAALRMIAIVRYPKLHTLNHVNTLAMSLTRLLLMWPASSLTMDGLPAGSGSPCN